MIAPAVPGSTDEAYAKLGETLPSLKKVVGVCTKLQSRVPGNLARNYCQRLVTTVN